MKLSDPQLRALVEAYRSERTPAEAARDSMRLRLELATHKRPAWQPVGVAVALAAAALLAVWFGARAWQGVRGAHADAQRPAAAPWTADPAPRNDRASAERRRAPARASAVVASDRPVAEALDHVSAPPDDHATPSSRRAPTAASRPVAPTPPAEAPVRDDVTLIAEAEAALRDGDPRRVLALVREHERVHPNASTAQERMALRVLALCALGRSIEGRGLKHAFLRDHPNSAYARRIEAACSESTR